MSDPRNLRLRSSSHNDLGSSAQTINRQRPESNHKVLYAPVEINSSPPPARILRSNLAPESGGPPNPQLAPPLSAPPANPPDHYAQHLRRYHPEVNRQTIQDSLFHEHSQRNIHDRLDALSFAHNHSGGLNWFGKLLTPSTWFRRGFWDTTLGAQGSKGRASVAQTTNGSMSRPTTRLQQLILHRDKNALLDELSRIDEFSGELHERRTDDLLTVLHTQRTELNILRDSRGLTVEEQHWSELLDGHITQVTAYRDRLRDGAELSYSEHKALLEGVRDFWRYEPAALQTLSNATALAKAAQYTDSEVDPQYRQAALRDIKNAAAEEPRDYPALLKTIEKRGLLAELEERSAAIAPPPDQNHKIETYQRGDKTVLRLHRAQIYAVLEDWEHEYTAVNRAHAKAFSKAWWGKVGANMKNTFAHLFVKSDRLDKIKGMTKASENVLDTVKNEMAINLEAIHHETGEAEQGGTEKRLESAAHVVGVVEHVGGAVAGIKQAVAKTKVIKHKRDNKARGEELMQDYQQQLDTEQGREAVILQYRSGVKAHYGKKLQQQGIVADSIELGVVSGQTARHTVQTAGLGMKMTGTAASTAGAMLLGGLGAAAVLESGEAVLGGVEAYKAGATKQQLEQAAKKLRQEIADKYGFTNTGDVNKHLEQLEKDYGDNEVFLADKALHEDGDQELLDAIRERQPGLKQQIDVIKAELQRLADTEALVKVLQDNQHHDVKTIVAVRSSVATAGYTMGFLVAVGVGGTALTILAPVTMAVAGGAVLGTYAYKGVKKSKGQWQADRATDAILGRADPKVIAKLHEQATAQGIDPQQAAFNIIAGKDLRWTAAKHLGQLKAECIQAKVRLSDEDIGGGAIDEAQHQQAILKASPTARFLHEVAKMPAEVIASIVDAHNDDEHDELGRKLIEAYLDQE